MASSKSCWTGVKLSTRRDRTRLTAIKKGREEALLPHLAQGSFRTCSSGVSTCQTYRFGPRRICSSKIGADHLATRSDVEHCTSFTHATMVLTRLETEQQWTSFCLPKSCRHNGHQRTAPPLALHNLAEYIAVNGDEESADEAAYIGEPKNGSHHRLEAVLTVISCVKSHLRDSDTTISQNHPLLHMHHLRPRRTTFSDESNSSPLVWVRSSARTVVLVAASRSTMQS